MNANTILQAKVYMLAFGILRVKERSLFRIIGTIHLKATGWFCHMIMLLCECLPTIMWNEFVSSRLRFVVKEI